LDAEKEEAGTARVKTRAGESIENLGDGKLDSGVIFKDREAEGFFGLNGRLRSEPMDVGVKVAIGLACKSRRPAFRAIGHNVPAFVIHELIPLQKKIKKGYFCTETASFQWDRRGLPLQILDSKRLLCRF
jgi:hypothetical protein